MKRIIHSSSLRRLGLLLAADLLLFGLTNASKVASAWLMIGFCLAVATLYYLLYGVVAVLRLYGLPIKRAKRLSLYMTGVAALLLALQSTGELGLRDVLVAAPLAIVAYIYGTYAKNTRRNLET